MKIFTYQETVKSRNLKKTKENKKTLETAAKNRKRIRELYYQ